MAASITRTTVNADTTGLVNVTSLGEEDYFMATSVSVDGATWGGNRKSGGGSLITLGGSSAYAETGGNGGGTGSNCTDGATTTTLTQDEYMLLYGGTITITVPAGVGERTLEYGYFGIGIDLEVDIALSDTGVADQNHTPTEISQGDMIHERIVYAAASASETLTVTISSDETMGFWFAWVSDEASSGNTLDAAVGSHTVTGASAETLANRAINSEVGAVAVTGANATLTYNTTLNAEAGSYAATGANADLISNYVVDLDAGSYAVTGANADLNVPAAGAYELDAATGSYTTTWASADTIYNRVLDGEVGSITVSGVSADVVGTFGINAEVDSYAVTGANADLVYTSSGAYELDAEVGSVGITGGEINNQTSSATLGFEMGGSFKDGRRVPFPFKETRKTKRIKRKLAKVEREQADITHLIVEAKGKPSGDTLGKLLLHEALLKQQIADYRNQLNQAAMLNKAPQVQVSQLALAQQAKQKQEQEQLLQAERFQQEEEDIIYIMAMLAAA